MVDRAYIGLGGNIGNVPENFARALEMLKMTFAKIRMSSLWETAPQGVILDQPWFINACIEVNPPKSMAPGELMTLLLAVESSLGRARARESAGGPRPIDLDLLVWGDRGERSSLLELPHPRLRERAFALAPLVELAGNLLIPGQGRAKDLLHIALKDPGQKLCRRSNGDFLR